jgi:Ca-activated chloride channel family protein
MKKRFWIALGLSLLLHAGVVTTTKNDALWETIPRPAWLPAGVDFAAIDEVIVLATECPPMLEEEQLVEELGEVFEDPALADVEYDDDQSLGDPRTLDGPIGLGGSDGPFEGPDCNGTLGIGGGAGGAFGGRRGGRRNLRAGGGGRMGDPAAWPDMDLRLVARVEGEEIGEFPLRKTVADADVAAWMASTRLTQTFANPFDEAVEAVYVFPLPSNAAVNAFEMQVAGRRILGVVRTREEAERVYDEARRAGKTASLLRQERPNLFTQSVANIAPRESVDVTVTYFHGLRYAKGAYEYVLPTNVAPRYEGVDVPLVAPATAASNAYHVSMPVLGQGVRSGAGVGLTLRIDAGVTIRSVKSPTHALSTQLDGSRATVTLADGLVRPDGDVVVRWNVAAEDVTSGFVAHRTEARGGFFSAFLVPMADPSGSEVGAREVTFVVDSSGSMNGIPIDTCKALVERSLKQMRPYDRFNIIQFAGSSGSLSEEPVAATPQNVALGIAYVNELQGSGGTQMLQGIRHWIAQPKDPRYLRTVVFLTDGLIGAEESILATIRDQGQDARWFAFGIGSSVNRYLIEDIGRLGNGASEVVLPDEKDAALAAADRLIERFDAPLLLNLELDTDGLPVEDVYPRRLPDLYAGQPVVVTGRYTGPASGQLWFRGTVAGREIAVPVDVDLPEQREDNASLGALWARTRIDEVEDALLGTQDAERDAHLAEIETLGLEHSLVTRRTSFVAVDDSRVVGDGCPVRLLQPAELPRHVRYWGVVGAPPGVHGAEVRRWGLTVADAEHGELMVASVTRRSRAAHAGLHRGFVIETVGGRKVRNARHFRALVEQAAGRELTIGYRNGAGEAVRETKLTRW